MTFFARPDLSNIQFKQSIGSVLTLSGETQIATTTGFTLSDGSGNFIILTADGADINKSGYVLGYDGLNKISLIPSSSGASMYNPPYKSPATVTLGGITAGTVLTGKTISCIIQDLLVPTMNPTLTAPASTFTLLPSTRLYETGSKVFFTGTTRFSRGCICPAYTTSGYRSGLPISYRYSRFGSLSSEYPSLGSCDYTYVTPQTTVSLGNNTFSSYVKYAAGEQPKNSSGSDYCTPLPSGTCTNNITISGIYPYYYGKVSSSGAPAGSNRPTINNALVVGGTKCVLYSTGTTCINFNSTSDDYIWFAIPSTSTSKVCWYVNASNNGSIGGGISPGCNLFPDFTTVSVTSAQSCWSSINYKVYVSNYQTQNNNIMELRNS